MADNKKTAAEVLQAVGGKENVTFVAHCMTRLRFNLKDMDAPDMAAIRKIDGVVGAQVSGGQFQVIVGQNVPKVYDELCALGGFAKQGAIDEQVDDPKEKLTPAAFGERVLNYLSSSMVPMIPVLLAAAMFKTIAVVIGPSMLKVVDGTDDFSVLMNMLYNACFYFLPIYLGFNAAKNLGATPMLGAFIGGVLIEPTFVQLATDGSAFSVYGIPCTPINYSQTVVPVLLSVVALYFIEKLIKKHMPDALSTVFTPLLTIALTIPLSLCLLAPLGSWLGNGFAAFFQFLGESGGIIAILGGGLLAALWLPLVISGMHVALIMLAIANFMVVGQDSYLLVCMFISLWAAYGTQIACFIKLRDKKEKSLCAGYLVSQLVGGVGEPFIYGMMFRYRKLFVTSIIGSFVSGCVAIILGVVAYTPSTVSNLLTTLMYVGGGTENLIHMGIAAAAGFIVSFVLTFLFGFTEDELENGPLSER